MSGLVEVVPVRVPGTYEILGSDMQILNMETGKLGKITANPGSMTYMAPSIKMSTNCNNPIGCARTQAAAPFCTRFPPPTESRDSPLCSVQALHVQRGVHPVRV